MHTSEHQPGLRDAGFTTRHTAYLAHGAASSYRLALISHPATLCWVPIKQSRQGIAWEDVKLESIKMKGRGGDAKKDILFSSSLSMETHIGENGP